MVDPGDVQARAAGELDPLVGAGLEAVGAQQRHPVGDRRAHRVPLVASECAAASTASRAMIRYVVSLPPAIITIPGTGVTTVCSREIREVGSDSPESSGRSPA